MKRIKWLFLLLVIVGPLHMIEQMIFGIDELYEMKRLVALITAGSPTRTWGRLFSSRSQGLRCC